MKQKILLILLLSSLLFWCSTKTSADFQESLYCTIQENTLIVSMKKNNNYLCKNYILYLQNRIYKEYQAIQQTNKLIQEGDNIVFWVDIKRKKLETIQKINLLINKIRHNIQQFEKNLITTIQKYITNNLKKEEIYFEKMLQNLIDIQSTDTKLLEIEKLIYQAQNHIYNITTTQSMDILLENLTNYIYIKNKITWILES